MKKWCLILLLFPFVGMAQFDFETRYFKIDAASLPDVEALSAFDINFETPSKFDIDALKNYNKVTANNYWQPVDMAKAVDEITRYEKNDFNINKLQSKMFARGGTAQYGADGATAVKNTVYKEQRGLDFLDPCPPFGVCGRCAPYRVGRGFR
ncbi:MAG: hypothetical protein HKN48_07805 [Flavobacteriaceae bacterium]|nr:hypothetical protein [Flavobacteriaceae bacterium]